MSACYRLVLDSVCRSNHHRLAVMALDHLEGETAGRWRDLFLKHRNTYLEGAKAPDAVFKDFKNHVLHVKEGDWGGAPAAAREWYRRTVRAMRAEDWQHAAWCAGVMSHYVVDPVQPFHTGQTEEEGAIHRAAEWSFFKAFPELLAILEDDLGYPEVPVPAGDDWLEKMVRAGAMVANQHYQTLIDHYDIEAGHRKPQDGLDQELKDVMAALIGYASVMLARVLGRAIAEAAAEPPQVNLALDTVGIVMATPGRMIAKRAEDVAERGVIAAQYAEFRKTGKVRETMSEDDRVVRRLHAEEVLKIDLSSLDCRWPKETGIAHGQGAEARPTKKSKRTVEGKEVQKAPPPVAAAKPAKPAAKPAVKPAPKPAPKPAAKTAEPVAAKAPQTRLTRDASVVDAPSIGPKTAGRLGVIGVKTVGDLLDLSPDEAAARIKQSHINARIIRDWQAQALLACSVPGLPGTAAQLLVGAGVTSVEDLATSDLDALADAIEMFAASNEGERALRGQAIPNRAQVKSWIAAALEITGKRAA
jgi:predicted flap endonuclease-1-like 5' DNA nuclease